MRGAPRAANSLLSILIVFLFLTAPVAAAGVLAEPDDAAAAVDAGVGSTPVDAAATALAGTPLQELADQIDGLPADMLEHKMPGTMARYLDPVLPTPDRFPGYAALDDHGRRLAWKAWVAGELHEAQRPDRLLKPHPLVDDFDAYFSTGSTDADTMAAEGEGATMSEVGEPRGLRPLWSLDVHGEPREVLPSGEGAYFLVTSRAVLHFDEAGGKPLWMVKPGGYLEHVEVADVVGDDHMDIVLSTWAFFVDRQVSLIVVDGATGEATFAGLAGDEMYREWTLTDVDGDGTDDILGTDRKGRIVARSVDGAEIYAIEPAEVSAGCASAVLAMACLYASTLGGIEFGDFNGDGVQDIVTNGFAGGFVYGFLVYFQPGVTEVHAFDGRTGDVLWAMPAAVAVDYGYAYPAATGDHDGDGQDDVLILSYQAASVPFVHRFAERQYVVLSGNGHTVLSLDSYTAADTAGDVVGAHYYPLVMADLDSDGTAEIFGIDAAVDMVDYEQLDALPFVGRAIGDNGGPTQEVYRHELGFPRGADIDGDFLVRDLDGDGGTDLLIHLAYAEYDKDDNLTDQGTILATVKDGQMERHETKQLFGAFDVDTDTGQAYAWRLTDDRWLPVDAEGRGMGDGMRLVMSVYTRQLRDVNDDGTEDLLVAKSQGYMWLDGRSGAILGEILRPMNRYGYGIFEEGSNLVLVERDWGNREYVVVDLLTGNERFRLVQRDGSDVYKSFRGLHDVSGDGRLDFVYEEYHWGQGDEDDVTYIRNMATGTDVMTINTEDSYLWIDDVMMLRRGDEVLERNHDDESMTLHTPSQNDVWTYDLADASLSAVVDGYVMVVAYSQGDVILVLSGDNGEELFEYPLEADAFVTSSHFYPMNKDRFPDLAVAYALDEGDEDYVQSFVMLDWANDVTVGNFSVSPPREVRVGPFTWSSGPLGLFSEEEYWTYHQFTRITAALDDWDGDGWTDVALREAGYAVVRSTATGEVLAVAPDEGYISVMIDINGDGKDEIGIVSDSGRLRMYAHTSAEVTLARENYVKRIEAPDEVQSEEIEEFLEDSEINDAPAPSFVLLLAVLSLVGFALRRRR